MFEISLFSSPNASFIPGTPVTPGHAAALSRNSPSPLTSTPIAKPTFDPKKNFSIFTPIKPDKKNVNQPNQSLQNTTQSEYSLLSPTHVKASDRLLQAAQNQQVIQAPSKGQSATVLGQGSILGPAFDQILKIMNSNVVPQGKPYYIMIDEGKPTQQMFLIQPPEKPVNQQDSANQNLGQAVATPNQKGSANQNLGQIVATPTTKQCASTTFPHQPRMKSILPNNGIVANKIQGNMAQPVSKNLNTSAENSIGQNSSNQSASSLNQSVEKPTDKSMNESGSSEDTKNSRFFKFCKLPETSSENVNICGTDTDKSTDRPVTPNLFDGDTEEEEIKPNVLYKEETDLETKCRDQDIVCDTVKKEGSILKKSETPVARKPIFRRNGNIKNDECMEEENSESDFKVQTSKRKPVIETPGTEQKIEGSKEGGDEVGEPLKTRRRGTKRRSLSRSNTGVGKRSKGVDFLDNLDDSKENQVNN